MKIKNEFKNIYQVKHNWFTRIYSSFLLLDGKKVNVAYKIIAYLSFIVFRWFAFLALKAGLKFSTEGILKKKYFPVRPTNSQFCSIYFQQVEKFYEVDVYGAIQALLPVNGVLVDVGSNWGHHSFLAAELKKATVFSFEPNPHVYADLVRIIEALNFDDRVKPFNIALGDLNGELTLKQNYFESGLSSINRDYVNSRLVASRINYLTHKLTFNNPISWKVKVMKLDDVLHDYGSIDLIKIDAEGAELNVLSGARNIIKNYKPKVIFELNTGDFGEFQVFNDFFREMGYLLFTVNSNIVEGYVDIQPVQSLLPFKHYNILAIHEKEAEIGLLV